MNNNEIIKYKTNEYELDVRIDYERNTVWLTQKQLSILYNVSIDSISLHIKNILKNNEIDSSVIEESSIVRFEGSRKVQRKIKYYNLEIIKLIGYKIDRIKTDVFNEWVIKVLDEYKKRR